MLGSILGSRAAMRVMSTAGSGRIFLIDGAGATGGGTPGSAAYGASKRALTQLKVESHPLVACSRVVIQDVTCPKDAVSGFSRCGC